MTELGEAGQQAIRAWVQDGGHYVGWQGGAQLAGSDGLDISMVREPLSTMHDCYLPPYLMRA